MHIDRYEFEVKCREVAKDIETGEATSSAWIWMLIGAAAGFVASCLKMKSERGSPILISRRKVKAM